MPATTPLRIAAMAAGDRASSSDGALPDADELLPTLKALADPVRLRVVLHIASAPHTVCACSIPESFGVSQPTMSHHLKRLVEAGILNREMRGSWAHFSIRPEALGTLSAALGTISRPTDPKERHEC